jgi:hypothetical protein
MLIKIKSLTIKEFYTQEFYMEEISSMDYPHHGEVFYFYGQAYTYLKIKVTFTSFFKSACFRQESRECVLNTFKNKVII